MPAILAYLGVQGFATRKIIKEADLKWLFLEHYIPNLPWITKRIFIFVLPETDPLDLRLYTIAQAFLLGCLMLSAGGLE